MTRFARAKGSKASNERVPETATSWGEMKTDLKKSQDESKTKEQRDKMNELRQKTYDEFVDSVDASVAKKWAEFPGKKTPMKAKSKLNKTKKQVVHEEEDESDDEVDPKIENFKKEIETVLQKSAQKRKMPKKRNEEHKRRKPDTGEPQTVTVNGETKKIVRYDGFPILETDVERLKELRKSLIKKGVPQSEVKRTMQTERRKAEKYLARVKKQVCFNCRKSGHVLSDCPDLSSQGGGGLVDQTGTGICFKCGSTEHKLNECKTKDGQALKYASCFICREQGHIARECPDNPRGLYPKGGGCRACGDVTHMKKDCPQNAQNQEGKNVSVGTIANADNIESLDGDDVKKQQRRTPAKKIVKF